MRSWLLLLSLLVSDLNPLRDGDGVMENWSLCRNLLLCGRTTPTGAKTLLMQTENCSLCIQGKCVYVSVQHKQRTSHLYPVHTEDHGRSLPLQELMGIDRCHIPAPVVYLLCGRRKSVPTLHKLHVISGEETGRILMRMIKDLPFSGSAWFPHHLSAASGCNFQAYLLQKSKSWSPAILVWLQKVLTERYSAAETELISCCFKESEVKQAPSIRKMSKKQKLKGQKTEIESVKRVMGSKELVEHDSASPSKAFVNQYEAFKAASLHPSDKSQLQRQRKAARVIKKNDYLNFLFQKTVQREQSLKASSVHDDDDDDDGFYVKRKLLLVPREEPESINKPRYKTRATLDDNKEDFSGRIITKQAELQRLEGESATERSHTHIEKGKRERLACTLQVGFTDKTDNNDDKQMLSEVGDDILIMFFLADAERETQTERKVILDADIKWKTVNIPIKELDDPPPLQEVTEENFIIEAHNSKCKYLEEVPFLLGIYAARGDIKAAKVTTKSAKTEKQVKATTQKIEQSETNNTTRGNTSTNHRKQDAPSEESVIPSPPSIKMMELEAAETEHTAETTTVNMEIKKTTSSADVFNQSSTREADGPPSTTTASPDSETDTETRFMRCRTSHDARATTGKAFSGLRMRERFSVKLQRSSDNEGRAATKRPQSERKDDQNDSENSFTSAEPPQTSHKQSTEKPLKIHNDKPPCRGLIHRTEAGWKHCRERYSGAGPEISSSGEPTGAFKETREQLKEPPSIRDAKDSDDDEYDHFYYFDGVLKRVRNNFDPSNTRQRLRRRSGDNTKTNVFPQRDKEETQGNLLRYMRRLGSRKDDGHST